MCCELSEKKENEGKTRGVIPLRKKEKLRNHEEFFYTTKCIRTGKQVGPA